MEAMQNSLGSRVQSEGTRPSAAVRNGKTGNQRPPCSQLGFIFYSPEEDARKEVGREEREAIAKNICAGCRLKHSCLEHVLIHDEPWANYGVWGGMTEGERREFREWWKENFDDEPVPSTPKLWIVLGKFWSSYHWQQGDARA